MKHIFYILLSTTILLSCTKSKKGNFVVNGNIKGLKKGAIYLQKIDSIEKISIDSILLDGKEDFTFVNTIKDNEIYYITLNKSDKFSIPFFSDKDTVTIKTKLEKFIEAAKISGSKNQELLEQHNTYTGKIQSDNLDLIPLEFEARKNNDTKKLEEIANTYNNNLKRSYLFTANFAINHPNKEVAPYLALTQMQRAQPKLIDTIYASLNDKVKKTKYGVILKEYLSKVKEN